MIKGVLFDMDGVLIDTERFYSCRRMAYLEEQGIVLDEIPDMSGSNDDAIWRCYIPDDAELRETLKRGYEAYALAHPLPYRKLIHCEAKPVLSKLREWGIKTAIASSSPSEAIRDVIDAADIASLLDYVVSGHMCRAFKPDPEIYLTAMEALGLSADEVLVIEDSPIGIEAGRRAGCRVLALHPPAGVHLDQTGADRIIASLSDILDEVKH